MTCETRVRTRISGFSLVEMLIVVIIIGIVASFVAPPVLNYLRASRIQSVAQAVAGEIQTARMKAISNNVNLGVTFGMNSNRTYGWTIEDDLDPSTLPNWNTIATAPWATLSDPASGQTPGVRTLPDGFLFVDPSGCRGGGAATDWAIRFRRLGTACGYSTAGCPPLTGVPVPPLLIQAGGGEFRVCVSEAQTGLTWTIRVTGSGRIFNERGNL